MSNTNGSYAMLDSTWVELSDKKIQDNGYCYVGRNFKAGFAVKVFVQKIEE